MIKKIYSILATLLALFLSANVNSQSNYRETVWLQVNRDIYLSGEDIYYNACLLESDTYKPSVLSKNIRVELIDEQGNSIVKNNIELSNSMVSNKISIPDRLKTGLYHVVSYTNWMRNFSESSFSSHPIRILNNNDLGKDSLIKSDKQLNIELNPFADPSDPALTKCSIYTTNSHHDPVSSRGVILSGPGDTVMTYHTDNTGWGSSSYHPADPNSYQIFAFGFDRSNINFKLPVKKTNKAIETTLSEKYGYLNLDLKGTVKGQSYKVMVHRLYSRSWFQSLVAKDNKLIFRIPVIDLPSGISQIVVLDSDNNILFKKLWSDYNEEYSDIEIIMGSSAIKTDEEYYFNYNTNGNFDNEEFNNLYLLADANIPGTRIEDYLPGLPGWPANYIIPASQEAFDAWIINNTYPDEICKRFFEQGSDSTGTSESYQYLDNIEFYPETRGGVFSGKILSEKKPLTANIIDIALTILNDNSIYSTSTDNIGRFAFTFPGQYGHRDYMLNFIQDYDPSWEVIINDNYADFTNTNKKHGATFTEEELDFLNKRMLNLKLENIYFTPSAGNSDNNKNSDSLIIHKPFYDTPDISVRVEEYIRLTNLREVIFEVVPFVNVRQVKKKYILKVTGEKLYNSQYPTLVLFDGIPVYDYNDMLNLPPERIKTIEAVNNFYIHGNAIFEGIIDIRSVNNDFGGLGIPPNTILSTFLLPQKGDYLPIVSEKPAETGIPNIDNILIWKKLIPGSAEKESIYFNNNPGRYNIFVYGFDSNGKWHSGKIILEN